MKNVQWFILWNQSAVFRINLYADSLRNQNLASHSTGQKNSTKVTSHSNLQGYSIFHIRLFVGNALWIRQGTMICFLQYLPIKPSPDYEEVQNCLHNFIIHAQARCKFLNRMQLLWKRKHSYLNISWVSKSISSPLMNRAESPGCNPNVPLKYWKEVGSH